MKVVTLSETMSQRLQDSCGRKPDYIIPMGFRENASPLQSSSEITRNGRSTDILIAGSLIAT
jgi:hypothetical protein